MKRRRIRTRIGLPAPAGYRQPAATALILFLALTGVHAQPSTSLEDRLSEQTSGKIDMWRFCGRNGLLPELEPPAERPPEGRLDIGADRIQSDDRGTRLAGDISVISNSDQMTADRALLTPDRQRIELTGNVHYRSELFEVNAESFTRDTSDGASSASELEFFVPLNHISGGAERMIRPDPEMTRLYDMNYTTCDPHEREWYFNASEMDLDHASGFGTGKHMRLWLKGIPILYFPYLTFPIDDRRKSGFLYPAFGESTRHGTELEVPWYWNIAPQADATLTPHYMSRRGLKLDTEWRHMNRWSDNELHTEYIDDSLQGADRSLLSLDHSGRLSGNWSTHVKGTRISDVDYFEDFGTDLSSTSRVTLSRMASVTGSWDNWRLVNRVQTYQILTDNVTSGNKPYRLLPQISLDGLYSNFALGLDFEMDSSYTNFDQDNRVTAQRFDVWPRLSRPFGSSGWFVVPAVGSRYTTYQLDYPENVNPPANQPVELERTVPVTSLDAGLIFERPFGDDDGYLQTLEPRVFYLKVPFRDQNRIPIFDTKRPDFSLFQLFQENRFVGADRMGDTEQLSGALSTRLIDRSTGEERLRLSLGQIHYYQDRQVTLRPGDTPETGERSGLILETEARLGDHWNASLTAERNPDTYDVDKGLFRLEYNVGNRYVFNLSYRYRRGQPLRNREALRQTDISFNLPVADRWSMAGRWNHDTEADLDLEKFLGLEYESCCWAFRVLAREFYIGEEDDARQFDNGVYFELSLKGFGKAGSDIGHRLENGIIGYQDPYE